MRNNATLTYKQIIDLIHPVKSFIFTQDSTYDPNNEFIGQTWSKLPNGSVIMASESDKSSNTNNFYIQESNIKTFSNTFTHRHKIYSTDDSTYDVHGFIKTTAHPVTGYGVGGPNGHGSGNTADYVDTFGVWPSISVIENTSVTINLGEDTPTNLDLTTILKHPICYIWLRTA